MSSATLSLIDLTSYFATFAPFCGESSWPRYHHIMHALFITGTDTGVGKTHAACLIARQAAARGLRVGAYKPVCSGAERNSKGEWIWDDVERLGAAINVPATKEDICPQRF